MADISGVIEQFPYAGLFIFLLLGGLGVPGFPEGATLILCGFLISTRVVGLLPALLVAYSGLLVGDVLFYMVGRGYGRKIVTKSRFRKIISPRRLSLLEDKFNKWGILLIFFAGRLFGETFLLAGIMRMPAPKLVAIDALSAAFAIVIWVGMGFIGGNSLRLLREDMLRIAHLSVLFVILVVVILLFIRHFKSKRQ